MPFDSVRNGASPPNTVRCIRCQMPIRDGEPMERVEFARDRFGGRSLSGPCHRKCARPISGASPLARFKIEKD